MIDPNVVVEAVAAALEARFDTSAANIYSHPENDPELPAVMVFPADPFIDYQETFGPAGLARIRLLVEVRVAVGGAGEADAYRTMYSLLGTGTDLSVFDALAADRRLDDLLDDATALQVSGVRRVQTDRGFHLSSTFPLVCHQRRS